MREQQNTLRHSNAQPYLILCHKGAEKSMKQLRLLVLIYAAETVGREAYRKNNIVMRVTIDVGQIYYTFTPHCNHILLIAVLLQILLSFSSLKIL